MAHDEAVDRISSDAVVRADLDEEERTVLMEPAQQQPATVFPCCGQPLESRCPKTHKEIEVQLQAQKSDN